MGRYAEYDEDDYRLPEGMTRIGYDADTQVYTFQDDQGKLWESAPGNRYGRLLRVGAEPVSLPAPKPRRRARTDPPKRKIPDTFEKLLKDDPRHNNDAIEDGIDDDNDDKTLLQRITAPVKPLRRALTDLISSTSKPSDPQPPSPETSKPTFKRSLSQRLTRRASVNPQPPTNTVAATTTPAPARRSTLSRIPEKPVSHEIEKPIMSETEKPILSETEKADAAETADVDNVTTAPAEREMSVVEMWSALGRTMSRRGK